MGEGVKPAVMWSDWVEWLVGPSLLFGFALRSCPEVLHQYADKLIDDLGSYEKAKELAGHGEQQTPWFALQ